MAMYRSYNYEENDENRTYVTGNMQDNMDNMDRGSCEMRRKMANDIRSLEFAITELALYLDTHANDEKALYLHNQYSRECKELKDKYQKLYGPLTINYPSNNKWRWIEEPWPWERGNF